MRLETERLVLRLPEPSDVDAYTQFFADPQVVRYTGGKTKTRVETADSLRRMQAHWDRHGIGLFTVVRRAGERVIGRVGFLVWDERWVNGLHGEPRGAIETELGWMLGREFWGSGYATEGAAAARDWALDELGYRRLISLIRRENEASVRVALRLGETLERRGIPGPFDGPVDLYSLAAGNGPAR
jgi:RimJ/RimL family protein N-acetyltransferase